MEPASSIGKPECSLHFRQMDAEERQPVTAASEKSGEASSLAHRKAEIPLDPVLPIVSNPLSTHPAKGLEYLESIPRPQLARLLVDGELLSKENGLGCYKRREPRCLKTLSEGWGVIVAWLKKLKPGEVPAITSEKLCELHKVVAAHEPEFYPGKFVMLYDKCGFKLPLHHSYHSDIEYFDHEGLSEAEGIYEQQIVQCSLTKKQASKKAAFFYKHGTGSYLPLGKNMAAELYRNIDNYDELKRIIVDHSQNQHEPSRAGVDGFYSKMMDELSRRTKKPRNSISRDREAQVQVAECLFQMGFSKCIRKVTPPHSMLKELTENTLLRLNQDLRQCRSEDELIRIVCRYTAEFQQLHPFKSVNGRTFTLLLQYLLMAYGLPPATLKSPESFLCCGQERLVGSLGSAIDDTRAMIQGGNAPGFVLHDFATPTEDEEYDNVCADIESVIKGERSGKSNLTVTD